jgi:putative FmdB family regulatory protein
MPIYEYSCADCERTFEKMRPMSRADDAVDCPQCGGSHTQRGLSLFAAFSRGNGESSHAVSGSGGCGNCGSHNCGSCGHH